MLPCLRSSRLLAAAEPKLAQAQAEALLRLASVLQDASHVARLGVAHGPAGLPSPTLLNSGLLLAHGPRSSSRQEAAPTARSSTGGARFGARMQRRAVCVHGHRDPDRRAGARLADSPSAPVWKSASESVQQAPGVISAQRDRPARSRTRRASAWACEPRERGVGGLALVSAPACSTAPGRRRAGAVSMVLCGSGTGRAPRGDFPLGLPWSTTCLASWWELPLCREAAQL